jgi:amidase
MARTDAAAAVVLGAIAGGPDPRDLVTKDSRVEAGYTRFSTRTVCGARIGVARDTYFGYSDEADELAGAAIEEMLRLGAVVVDPADIPTAADLMEGTAELEVLLYEFKAGINEYLASRPDLPVRTLGRPHRLQRGEPRHGHAVFRARALRAGAGQGGPERGRVQEGARREPASGSARG